MARRISNATRAVAMLVVGLTTMNEAAAGTQSFRRSCTDISVVPQGGQTVIRASCSDGDRRGGKYAASRPTTLVVPPGGCADIENRFGTLRCIGANGAPPGGGWPNNPGGSWSQTCSAGFYVDQSVFQAMCAPRGTRSPSVVSRIDTVNCPGRRLRNDDGRLYCE